MHISRTDFDLAKRRKVKSKWEDSSNDEGAEVQFKVAGLPEKKLLNTYGKKGMNLVIFRGASDQLSHF